MTLEAGLGASRPSPLATFRSFRTRRVGGPKKIRRRFVFFGPWDDPAGALKKYEAEKGDLHAGRKPREVSAGGVTVKDLCNKWLAHKEDK